MAERSSGVPAIVGSPVNSQREWVQGWQMVAVALVAYVLGAVGMFFAFGLFFNPLSSEFHWSRESISGFNSISSITYAVASPFVGRLADRFGVKRVILTCAVIVGLAFGSQSLLTGHLWHYYALAFVMGAASSGTSALTFGNVISHWFNRSRGLALSILACGSGLGGIIVPPFAQFLISHYGWREAYFLLGLTMLTAGTIPVALVLKDAPSARTKEPAPSGATPTSARISKAGILTSYTFLTLLVLAATIGVSYVGVLTHLIPMLTDRGMSAGSAARLFSLLGVAAIGGHLLVGACFDRFRAATVAAVMLVLSGVGVAAIGVAHSVVTLGLATLMLGAALGADTDVLPYLVGRYFGLSSYGEFLGYFFASGTLGAAGGALLMGRVFDLYHSYVVMTNFIAVASIVAALLVVLLPTPPSTNMS